jgi:hypothetical protein
MKRIETIRQSLSSAKADLYALKQSGAEAEALADAESRVRMNQEMLERAEAREQ